MTRFHYWFKWQRAEARADKAEILLASERSKNDFLEKRLAVACAAAERANREHNETIRAWVKDSRRGK